MSANSKIEWCDATFNPWEGCTKVSPGCANCYAANRDARWHRGKAIHWGHGAPRRRTSAANWKQPVKWDKAAAMYQAAWDGGKGYSNGFTDHRTRVFCSSLADWLDDEVPIEWLADLLALIHATPHLDWLMLTKRPENFHSRLVEIADLPKPLWERGMKFGKISNYAAFWSTGAMIPENVWIGTSAENQAMADRRIPQLLAIPAKVRFLSCEPLLEAVDLLAGYVHPSLTATEPHLSWVICGGESGPGARPMHPDWARSLRNQCEAAGVPFFMKQMGGTRKPFPPIPTALMVREFPIGGEA